MPPERLPRPHPPRGLIFLASAWLVVSWVLSIGWRPPVQAHAASYTPGVRMLLLAVLAGITLAWPLVRLSGPPRAWPIRQALLDVAVLLCLAQVVVWPLRLVTPWPAERAAAVDLCLGGWAMASTAIVALGTIPVGRAKGLLRVGCMLVALGFVAFVPGLAVLRGDSMPFRSPLPSDSDTAWWGLVAGSPVTAIYALSGGGAEVPSPVEWSVAWSGWWAAAGAWAVAIAVGIGRLRRKGGGDMVFEEEGPG